MSFISRLSRLLISLSYTFYEGVISVTVSHIDESSALHSLMLNIETQSGRGVDLYRLSSTLSSFLEERQYYFNAP